MPDYGCNAHIHLVYWGYEIDGSVQEFNEIYKVFECNADFVESEIKEHVIRSKNYHDVVQCIKNIITHTPASILYISAHGDNHGLAFDRDPKDPSANPDDLKYDVLRDALRECSCNDKLITLVFGACKALEEETNIQMGMPDSIVRIYGFTRFPSGFQVAQLIGKIIVSSEENSRVIKTAIGKRFSNGVPIENFMRELVDEVDPYVAAVDQEEAPHAYVKIDKTTAPGDVVRLHFVDGKWERIIYHLDDCQLF
jgi:hypothetical protein